MWRDHSNRGLLVVEPKQSAPNVGNSAPDHLSCFLSACFFNFRGNLALFFFGSFPGFCFFAPPSGCTIPVATAMAPTVEPITSAVVCNTPFSSFFGGGSFFFTCSFGVFSTGFCVFGFCCFSFAIAFQYAPVRDPIRHAVALGPALAAGACCKTGHDGWETLALRAKRCKME
jgi:hypothetical protein